jgi:hypothetical protein
MPSTTPERYAVVSCHVERPLDDHVWSAFAALQERRPGGLPIAALLRPPDRDAGELDEVLWLARAREAAARGPLGHHTHFTSPTHARPTGGDPAACVLREGAWIAERGVRPTLFCGGGWYTDRSVAAACAELGYVDCTPRASRPGYLPAGAPWASLAEPAVIELPSGATLPAIPTTHTVGDLARALVRRTLPAFVHVYLHDTDLLQRRRRVLLELVLRALGRRARPADLDAVARSLAGNLSRATWDDVARS